MFTLDDTGGAKKKTSLNFFYKKIFKNGMQDCLYPYTVWLDRQDRQHKKVCNP